MGASINSFRLMLLHSIFFFFNFTMVVFLVEQKKSSHDYDLTFHFHPFDSAQSTVRLIVNSKFLYYKILLFFILSVKFGFEESKKLQHKYKFVLTYCHDILQKIFFLLLLLVFWKVDVFCIIIYLAMYRNGLRMFCNLDHQLNK